MPTGTRSKNVVRLAALTLAAGVASVGFVGPTASAATTPPVPGGGSEASAGTGAALVRVQSKAAKAITRNVAALDKASAAVGRDKYLGSDQAVLVEHLQSDASALQQLGQKIAADTTVASARADARLIDTDFRVFTLVLPAARLTAKSDRISLEVVPKLTALSTKIAARTSADGSTVAPLIADLNNQISSAKTASAGIGAMVEAYTPAQWDVNHDLLAAARASVKTAAGDLKKARSDLKGIRADLKALRAEAGSSTSTTTA